MSRVAEFHRPGFSIDVGFQDGDDHLLCFGEVIHVALAAPLPVGEQQRIGDIQVTVRRGILPLRVVVILPPGHEAWIVFAGMAFVKAVEPSKWLCASRIMARHESSDDHPIP